IKFHYYFRSTKRRFIRLKFHYFYRMPTKKLFKVFLFLVFFAQIGISAFGQFYNGMNQTFGKNRVQYTDFFWTYYRYDKYEYYFYPEGKKVADFAAKSTPAMVKELQEFFDYYLEDKIYFVIFTKLSHFRQSNIGLQDTEGETFGTTQVSGNKVFLYFDGDYEAFSNQIKQGVSTIIVNR